MFVLSLLLKNNNISILNYNNSLNETSVNNFSFKFISMSQYQIFHIGLFKSLFEKSFKNIHENFYKDLISVLLLLENDFSDGISISIEDIILSFQEFNKNLGKLIQDNKLNLPSFQQFIVILSKNKKITIPYKPNKFFKNYYWSILYYLDKCPSWIFAIKKKEKLNINYLINTLIELD